MSLGIPSIKVTKCVEIKSICYIVGPPQERHVDNANIYLGHQVASIVGVHGRVDFFPSKISFVAI